MVTVIYVRTHRLVIAPVKQNFNWNETHSTKMEVMFNSIRFKVSEILRLCIISPNPKTCKCSYTAAVSQCLLINKFSINPTRVLNYKNE